MQLVQQKSLAFWISYNKVSKSSGSATIKSARLLDLVQQLRQSQHTICISRSKHAFWISCNSCNKMSMPSKSHEVSNLFWLIQQLQQSQHTFWVSRSQHALWISCRSCKQKWACLLNLTKVSMASWSHEVSMNSRSHEVSTASGSHEVSMKSRFHEVSMAPGSHEASTNSRSHEVGMNSGSHEVSVNSRSHEVSMNSGSHEVSMNSGFHEISMNSRSHEVSMNSISHEVSMASGSHEVSMNSGSRTTAATNRTCFLDLIQQLQRQCKGRVQQGTGSWLRRTMGGYGKHLCVCATKVPVLVWSSSTLSDAQWNVDIDVICFLLTF